MTKKESTNVCNYHNMKVSLLKIFVLCKEMKI